MRILIFALMLPITAWAQAPTAEDDMLKAYQREYAFLAAQKESLQKQVERVRANHRAKTGEAEGSIRKMEAQVVRVQAENDRLFEDVQVFERRRKEDQARESTLKSLWKRMQKGISENRVALDFRNEAVAEEVPPEIVDVVGLARLSDSALEVLQQSQSSQETETTYLNAQDELVEGKVLRLGRVAAFSMKDGSLGLLAPAGQGRLKELEQITSDKINAKVTPLYAFESIKEKLKLKKPAGWKEHAANMAPILFLGVLFLMVGWLFTKLARI